MKITVQNASFSTSSMRRSFRHSQFNLGQLVGSRGFTLIELLIVIGILGILAAALIATINPFEQLNKASDTNVKNVSVEFHNALLRYYTTHGALPWETTADGGNDACNTSVGSEDPNAEPLDTLGACITALSSEGELKAGFSDFQDLDKIFVTEPNPQTGNQNDIAICYQPVSISQQKEVAVKYAQNGANGTTCKSTGGTTNCYWCTQ